jgi:hypothetical protein
VVTVTVAFKTVVPLSSTALGLIVQVARAGAPEQVSDTELVNSEVPLNASE